MGRKLVRPMAKRQNLKDMVQCENCHKCAIRQEIISLEITPEEVCEYATKGVCTLEETRWAHTLEEIGQILGISRERVRQIEVKAVRRMQHAKRTCRLRPFYNDSLEREKLNGRPYTLYSEDR